MKSFLILSSALLLGLSAATAGTHETSVSEVRELTLPAGAALDVNTGGMGAITVQGWDKDYVQVRATISADTYDLLSQVQLGIADGRLWVFSSANNWGVAFELSVPRQFGLHLETGMGAIAVTGVSGAISIETGMGAITLAGVGGDVTVKTGMGAIDVTLDGAGWDGKGLSATTGMGAIRITAPAGYAAHFDLSTKLGELKTTFPGARIQSTSFFGKRLVFDSGNGGAPIHANTGMGRIDLLAADPH